MSPIMGVLFKKRRVHFVGLGGIGMSGLAEILLKLGFSVQGSDQKNSPLLERLQLLGATVYLSHHRDHVAHAELLVTSTAVSPDNPEVREARTRGIPIIRRAEMLAELMRLKLGVAVAGSHGKTSTTSMLGLIAHEAGLDPTVVIGGRLARFNSNVRHGLGQLMIAEADESDGSFLHLNPAFAIVTNIDREHMDHYGTMDRLTNTFLEFLHKIPFYGAAIVCGDCPLLKKLLPQVRAKTITYGFHPENQLRAVDVERTTQGNAFSVVQGETVLGRVRLSMPGKHNILNSLAATAVAIELDIPMTTIQQALNAFSGVDRRLQVLHRGRFWLVDDYGHHPTEIQATLSALKELRPGSVNVLFQPHRYTRTQDLLESFAHSFHGVAQIFLMDIYPASEPPLPGVDSHLLAAAIKRAGGPPVVYVGNLTREALLEKLTTILPDGETLLTLGAGHTTEIAHQLLGRLTSAVLHPRSPAPSAPPL